MKKKDIDKGKVLKMVSSDENIGRQRLKERIEHLGKLAFEIWMILRPGQTVNFQFIKPKSKVLLPGQDPNAPPEIMGELIVTKPVGVGRMGIQVEESDLRDIAKRNGIELESETDEKEE